MEFRKNTHTGRDVHNATIAMLEELKAYRETGLTPEQVKELRDQWKPHPEIKPENGQEVLVQMRDGHITGGTYNEDDPAGFFDDHEEWIMGDDVVAWMPMPERYIGGKR